MITKYPYTDFNEYNLDWCITKMRDLITEWAETKTEWSDMQQEFADLKEYVIDKLSDEHLKQFVSDKIDEMAADGTLIAIIAPYLPFVTPEMFGAVGDGVADDTQALQTAVNSNKTVICTSKQYKVSIGEDQNDYDFYYAIKTPSDTIVDFNGASIFCAPVDGAEKEKYAVIYLTDCDNVLIKNGVLIGDKNEHIGTMSEYGHGIACFNCQNSVIDNFIIHENTGDGICLQANWTTEDTICTSDNIKVKGCTIYNCRRQGISVVGCNNASIDNCYIYDIAGTNPHSCIDVEGNENVLDDYPRNTIISNCRLLNTADGSYRGIMVYPRQYNTLITGCECSDISLKGNAEVIGCKTDRVIADVDGGVMRDVSIKNCIVSQAWIKGNSLTCNDCEIDILFLNTSGDFTTCYGIFNNSIINSIQNSNTSAPDYELTFNNCVINSDNADYIEGKTIKKIILNNSVVNSMKRCLAGLYETLECKNTVFNVTQAVSSSLFYATSLITAILYNCTINTDKSFTTASLFGPNTATPTNITIIGNVCPDRGVVCEGTVATLISKNNYRTDLNN